MGLVVQGELPRRLGGRPALDFVNTVDPRHAPDRREYLSSYPALILWGVHAELLDQHEAAALLDLAARQPQRAGDACAAAVEFREQLYAATAALLQRHPPKPAVLVDLTRVTTAALARRDLTAGGARLRWQERELDADVLLRRVALNAADLLTGSSLDRVHECPGQDGCGWLFLDNSKSGTRRWCSMQACGNRTKVRRHRASAAG